MELNELKKQLKSAGFTVSIKTLSHGKHGVIKHIETGKTLTGNVFDEKEAEFWGPANRILPQESVFHNGERVYGLHKRTPQIL